MGREPGYRLLAAAVPPVMRAWFRCQVEGLEHIPLSGPAIIAANHVSYVDPLALGLGVHRAGRRPRFLSKSELFKVPGVSWVLRRSGQIPVHRGTRDAAGSLAEAEAALADGQVVLIFPEGTTTDHPDFSTLPPKTGVARLTLRTGVPVIPCATWGGQWFWTKQMPLSIGPGKEVWVRFGPAMTFPEFEGREADREAWREVAAKIMDEINVLGAGLRAAKPWVARPQAKRYLKKKQALGEQ